MRENGSQILTGQPAPGFFLPDIHGLIRSLLDFRGNVVVLNFWSAECPWARRADESLLRLGQAWGERVTLLAIASNVNESPELIRKTGLERGLPVLLIDRDSRIADLFGAETTPHLFVIDPSGIVRYQGAFDDVTFRQREPRKEYLRVAVEAVLLGHRPDPERTPAYGCAIVRPA